MAGIWGIMDDIFSTAFGSTAFGKSSLMTTMAFNNTEVAASLAKTKAVSAFNGLGGTAASDITLNVGNAQRVIKKGEKISVKNSNELSQILGMGDNIYSPLQDATKQQAFTDAIDSYRKHTGSNAVLSGDDFQKFIGREGKEGLGAFNTVKGYFGDEELGKTRRRVALGAGAATAVGVRYLSGGNMSTTAQGERNIAGIPFI